MDCQLHSRRRGAWGDIEEAPQVKRIREDKVQENEKLVEQRPVEAHQQPPSQPAHQEVPPATEKPKFYISAPIQGFTANNQGGCRYLFF